MQLCISCIRMHCGAHPHPVPTVQAAPGAIRHQWAGPSLPLWLNVGYISLPISDYHNLK